MTFRTKQRLFFAALLILTVVFMICFLYFSVLKETVDSMWVAVLVYMVGLLLTMRVNNRRHQLTLPIADEIEPMVIQTDFSNRFEWVVFVQLAVVSLACAMVIVLPSYVQMREQLGDLPLAYKISLLGKVCMTKSGDMLFLFIASLIAMFYTCVRFVKNQYLIEGDMLVIREYRYWKAQPELRIPLEMIRSVSVSSVYSHFPILYLDVNGVERKLQANSYPYELAQAIQTHNRQKQAK